MKGLGKASAPSLRVVPLGGLGEIGKNMMALEVGEDIVVIDAGVLFPKEEMLGVDLVLPDVSYLKEQRDRVRAVLVTHGHEDHIGALPYVLRDLDVPIYAPRLAHGLIGVKLKEHHTRRGHRLVEIAPGRSYRFGSLRVEWFRVCHSIPDAMGLAIHTPLGLVLHTGDFKIDHTPVDGKTIDFHRVAQLAQEGVLLLLSDSTYAERGGYTASERVVGESLNHTIGQAPGRVMVATFASLISRMQQVIDAAARHGRKVAVIGRSMADNVEMATRMGYLRAPDGVMVSRQQIRRLPPEEVLILTTGSQGEPTSALVRISNRDHRDVDVQQGDTIIISAHPIPGNETAIAQAIDNLCRQGAQVLHSGVATVHVHGHGSQEELKMMLNLARPRYFVPVHGEYRHLVAHAKLAQSVGVAEENAFVLEDGDVLELTPTTARVVGRVPAGPVYVDGLHVWDMKSVVLRDRKMLSRDGILVVVLPVDRHTGRVIRDPEIVSTGFVEMDKVGELYDKTVKTTLRALDHGGAQPTDHGFASTKVKEALSTFLHHETGRRPMILPVTIDV